MELDIKALVVGRVTESCLLKQELLSDHKLLSVIEEAGIAILKALRSGHKLIVFGNGGSAADAQHIAAELTGRYLRDRPGIPCLALTTNTSALTAIGNDYSYADVFVRQLQAFASPDDVVLAISTSGNSQNVLRAVEFAREKRVSCIGMTGRSGGQLKDLVDYSICVPSDNTPRIQEAHILIGHILCEIAEEGLFGAGEKTLGY